MSVLRKYCLGCNSRTGLQPVLLGLPQHFVARGPSRRSLRRQQQFLAAHKQVHERTGDKQAVRVFLQSPLGDAHEEVATLVAATGFARAVAD